MRAWVLLVVIGAVGERAAAQPMPAVVANMDAERVTIAVTGMAAPLVDVPLPADAHDHHELIVGPVDGTAGRLVLVQLVGELGERLAPGCRRWGSRTAAPGSW